MPSASYTFFNVGTKFLQKGQLDPKIYSTTGFVAAALTKMLPTQARLIIA